MKRIIAILLGALCGFCCFACSKVKKSATYEITYSLVVNGEVIGEIPDHLKKPDGAYPSEYTTGNCDVLNVEIIQPVDGLVETYEDETHGKMTFQGWFLDEACTKPFKGVSNIMVGKIELYAKFKKESWKTITYYAVVNGQKKDLSALPEQILNGVSLPSVCAEWAELEVGDLKGVPGEYEFRGWFTDENCEQAFDLSEVEGDSLVLYAKIDREIWTKFY